MIYTLEEITEVAKMIIQESKHKVLLFNGEMGAGKTTLIKELCKELGVTETSSSPTFSLVNEYLSSSNETIYHFDFYRIKNEEEAFDIGFEDYIYSNNWCFIEWPEKVKSLLPINTVSIEISLINTTTREIYIKNN